MAHITLQTDEAATLARALETYLSDLRMEVADTDAQGVRDELKREEAVIARVLEQLRAR